ncbi:MAG: hypothetical protein QOF80_1593 [Verrucomicrobiota bacterium]|jgi:hypothetical protein
MTPLNKWIILALALAVLGPSKQLRAEDLESVFRAPARYHHQRVTFTGVLVGDGWFLELFKNASDAKGGEHRRSAWVVLPDGLQKPGPYDMRRARVVGIVDAVRGRRNNPFQLKAEKLVMLSGRVIPWEDSAMVFYNDTEAAVLLRVGVPPTQTELLIPPKNPDGFLSIELQYSTLVQVMTVDRKLIFEDKISGGRNTPYYDAKNAASYFRIIEKKIERVSPAMAASWGWKR